MYLSTNQLSPEFKFTFGQAVTMREFLDGEEDLLCGSWHKIFLRTRCTF